MADLPGGVLGSLFVHPGALAAAAEPVHAVGRSVLRSASILPSGYGVDVVGQPLCAQTLLATCRLIVQAITASAGGLDKLAEALGEAAVAYEFADADALAGWSW